MERIRDLLKNKEITIDNIQKALHRKYTKEQIKSILKKNFESQIKSINRKGEIKFNS
jgi:hypothetical protein